MNAATFCDWWAENLLWSCTQALPDKSWGQQAATQGSFWWLELQWHSCCSGLFLFGWVPWECALLFVWRQQKTYHPAFLSLDFQHCRCFANTHDYFHSQTLLQDEFCYPLKCQSWVLKKVKSDTIYHTSKVIISVFMTQWLPQKSSARRAVLWGCMEGQWCFEQTPNVFTMSTLV